MGDNNKLKDINDKLTYQSNQWELKECKIIELKEQYPYRVAHKQRHHSGTFTTSCVSSAVLFQKTNW